MFAIPGWSISAEALKTQVETKAPTPHSGIRSTKANSIAKESRKRKRGLGSSNCIEVTEENLGDLWNKHIEKKVLEIFDGDNQGVGKLGKKKRTRKGSVAVHSALDGDLDVNGDSFGGFSEAGDATKIKPAAPIQEKKKKRKSEVQQQEDLLQANNRGPDTEDLLASTEKSDVLDNGKAKYEQRRENTQKKRERKARLQANGSLPPTRPEPPNMAATIPASESKSSSSRSNKSKLPHSQQEPPPSESSGRLRATDSSKLPQASDARQSTKLTPLQQRMAAKLTSSRFRHLNEVLYTSPSDQAMRLFTEAPQNYTSYHAGFRAQVAVWPQNPVEGFIDDIKTRAKVSVPTQSKLWRDRKKGKRLKESSSDVLPTNRSHMEKLDPLPRTKGTCTIADLGCGDAQLSASLQPLRISLHLNLLSFDLAKGDTPNAHLITVADITNLLAVGIRDSSVDIAICCLSLMGTNWVSVVDECSRIVRGGGEVWIAEIKSRFARPGQIGRKKSDAIGKKKKSAPIEDQDEEDAIALVEAEDPKRPTDETDVSAFIQVFERRGFKLKSDPDMTNKMFVRMRFTKGLRLENEKGGAAKFGDGFRGKQARMRFLEGEDGGGGVEESMVLKPCVYKIR